MSPRPSHHAEEDLRNPPPPTTFHQHRYADELDRLVRVGCAWLDIGAGHRIHSGWLAPSQEDLAGRPAYFAGCDLDDDILRNPHLHDARVASVEDLPWHDGEFDLVSANMVVEHLDNPTKAFGEVLRVLKPGGRLVFVTPNKNHPVIRVAATIFPPRLRRMYRIVKEGVDPSDVFPTRYRCNTVVAVRETAVEVGFGIELSEVFLSAPPILPAPLARLEAGIAEWLFRRTGLFGSNLVVILHKPVSAP